MRLRAILFAAVAFGAAGLAAWRVAEVAAVRLEIESVTGIEAALVAAGQTWAHADADGLNVMLTGTAPDETSRVKVVEIARTVVSGWRIEDRTEVAAAMPLPPPPFALELLRNENDVSLIGLVPESGGQDVIRAALGAGGLGEHVTDMLETADEPAPDGWQAALGFALSALAELPRAKISVAPAEVKVAAVADSDAARDELEARLRRATPSGVNLSLDIGAPRPVIAPFVFDFAVDGGTSRLARCSAGTDEAAAAIVAAAREAGASVETPCAVGLGSPSPDWAAAMIRGIETVASMGGGRFVASDVAATLTGAPGLAPETLNAAVSGLRGALPDVFQLTSVAAPQMAENGNGEQVYAPGFLVTLSPDGGLDLSGPVGDAAAREAVASYAAALFTSAQVSNDMVIDPDLPAGWSSRILAAVEAVSAMKAGEAEVTLGQVRVAGWGIDPDVTRRVSELLASKVGDDAVVDVAYNAAAAEAAAQATRMRPEICADQVDAILDAEQIGFERGSAEIAPESRGLISAIADVLRGCPGVDFEIGGHTDSQGSPESNRLLSEARAQAVLVALRSQQLPQLGLVARGFGAEDPVADNSTEEGRARNRRIEFTLFARESLGARLAAPAIEATRGPSGEAAEAGACAATVSGLVAETPIEFEPGAATLTDESAPIIAAVSEALRACPDAAIDVGGYTDSQGSEDGNLRLSQERAEAVLAALRQPDLPLPNLVAHGYGEADPVADNSTEEGRARNRRIEFVPVAEPEPTPVDESARAAAAAGTGEEAEDGADPAPPDEAADALAEDGQEPTLPAEDGPAAAGAPSEDQTVDAALTPEAAAACVAAAQARIDAAGIAFEPGSSEIEASSQTVIDAVAGELRSCPAVAVEIGGHTDSQGSEGGNTRLSQARADSVLSALRGDELPLPNATARGYGESQPIADNGTAAGRAQNRRIAVTLLPTGEAPEGAGAAEGEQNGDGTNGSQ